MSEKSDDAHSELMMLYTNSINEIHNFKQQQWHVTNYAMLVYAGLFSLSRVVASTIEMKLVLLAIIIVTFVLAGLWVKSLDSSIHARRARLDHIREKHFTSAFKSAREAGPSERIQYCWVFTTIMAIGAAVASVFLFLPSTSSV